MLVGDRTAANLQAELKKRNLLVRYFREAGLDDKLRITVGTDDQNQLLIEQLNQLLAPSH